jgi:Domain of unknown function (DUF4129)
MTRDHAGSAELLAGGPGIGRIPARNLARRELAQSMYRPSWLARVLGDIGHWFSSLVSPSAGGRVSWWGVALLCAVLLTGVAAALYWLGPASLTRRLRGQPVVSGRARTAAEYRDAADRLAVAGSYQGAIIERIRAIAADLEARGILLPRPARTAAELAAEAGMVFPAEAAGLAAAGRLFDEVRYGGRAGTQPGYAGVTALDLRLQAAAASQPARTAASAGDGPGADGTGADGTGADRTGADGTGADRTGADRTGADGTGAQAGLPPLGPLLADPVLADTVLADPVLADPVLADPVLADPVIADPVPADPALADPALADPALADPALADPARTGTTQGCEWSP